MNKNVKPAILALTATSMVLGGVLAMMRIIKEWKKERDTASRYRSYYNLTRQWLDNSISNVNILSYFEANKYKSAALYGMGTLGELLYKELKKSGVNVCCFIDKDAEGFYEGIDGIPVVNSEEFTKYNPDVVIVTPIYDFDEICKMLSKFNQNKSVDIASIEDVIIKSL